MSETKLYSWVIQDGDDLRKINGLLSNIRRDELIRFDVVKLNQDADSIYLEATTGNRFWIASSNPANGSHLSAGTEPNKAVVLFSEPVSESSLADHITVDGITTTADVLEFGYRVDVEISGLGTGLTGLHTIEFSDDVMSEDGDKIFGRRYIVWSTSSCSYVGGGTGLIPEPRRVGLQLARLSVQGPTSFAELLRNFYASLQITPDLVIGTKYISGYPEAERSILYILYEFGIEPPHLIDVSIPPGANLPWDLGQDPIVPLSATWDKAIDTSYTLGAYLDDTSIVVGDITYSNSNKSVSIALRPTTYGSHWLEFRKPIGIDSSRPDLSLVSFGLEYCTSCPCTSEISGSDTSNLLPTADAIGDMLYWNGGPKWAILAPNTTPSRLFLCTTGPSNPPTYQQVDYKITSINTTNYTASIGDLVLVDPTAGGFNVQLPPATPLKGRGIIVKNISSSTNIVTILPDGLDTIDNVASLDTNTSLGSTSLVAMVGGWVVT